jgi:hypothetical protein
LAEEIEVLSSSDTNDNDPLVALIAIMEFIINNDELALTEQQVRSLIKELKCHF